MPVLEIGGTHIAAGLVESGRWAVSPGSLTRVPIDAQSGATELFDHLLRAAGSLQVEVPAAWVAAVPGPFDYARGIALFEQVGKFEHLFGKDIRRVLLEGLIPRPAGIRFVNDADAFGVGQWVAGTTGGHQRAVCLTLGTGIGSAFLDDGVPVSTGTIVPPEGRAHRINYRGRPLEETVSRRAIRAAYAAASGIAADAAPDVQILASRSRHADVHAARALRDAFEHLGMALASVVDGFEPGILILGGSMAQSWDIVEPAIRRGLTRAAPGLSTLEIAPARFPDEAALLGAACWAAREEGR